MNPYQTLSYQDIVANAQVNSLTKQNDFIVQRLEDKNWGALETRTLDHSHVNITEYKAVFNGKYQVQYDVEQMLRSMNVCMVMQGDIGLTLTDSKFSTDLSSLQHHNIYANETAYSLWINQFVNVVHLAIDVEYYADLLCENDRWTATMKEKLLKKELICNGDGQVNASMQQAVHTILHNSLTGNLKNLLVEGKILEIVALQLNEFANQQSSSSPLLKMRSTDFDTFHDIKVYLDRHFTEDLSLKGLSRMFGLNEFKLKKGFKQLFNTTVFDYIQEQKMNYSKQLLCDQGMYVNEVASLVGYKNPNHFSTAFKRKFGINPTALK
jgi:AraC family transcriptional regulator, transcriptional activator of the genes for pyochelin and ferripyochelin receptors